MNDFEAAVKQALNDEVDDTVGERRAAPPFAPAQTRQLHWTRSHRSMPLLAAAVVVVAVAGVAIATANARHTPQSHHPPLTGIAPLGRSPSSSTPADETAAPGSSASSSADAAAAATCTSTASPLANLVLQLPGLGDTAVATYLMRLPDGRPELCLDGTPIGAGIDSGRPLQAVAIAHATFGADGGEKALIVGVASADVADIELRGSTVRPHTQRSGPYLLFAFEEQHGASFTIRSGLTVEALDARHRVVDSRVAT